MAAQAGGPPPPVAASAEDLALVDRLQEALREPARRPRGPPAAGPQPRGARPLGGGAGGAGAGGGDPRRRRRPRAISSTSPRSRILAAGGYVSPEAEAALSRALALDPTDPAGRYYSALTLMQGGRPDLAYRHLVGAGRRGPGRRALDGGGARRRRRGGAAGRGSPPPGRGARADGGGRRRGGGDAAGRAAGDDRGHGRRSSRSGWPTEGGPPEDWAQLIRSLGVLGRRDEAAAILAEARQKHAGDAAGARRDRGGRPRRGARAVSVARRAPGRLRRGAAARRAGR